MIAQQDLMYGRRPGAWASKPESGKKAQRVDIPASGGPLDGITCACHSYGTEPVPPEEFSTTGGHTCQLQTDGAGRRHYQWTRP